MYCYRDGVDLLGEFADVGCDSRTGKDRSEEVEKGYGFVGGRGGDEAEPVDALEEWRGREEDDVGRSRISGQLSHSLVASLCSFAKEKMFYHFMHRSPWIRKGLILTCSREERGIGGTSKPREKSPKSQVRAKVGCGTTPDCRPL